MKRAIAIAVSICTLVAWSLAAPQPASGHGADVCVGNTRAQTASNVFYPTFGPSALGSFNSPGECLLAGTVAAGGRFTESWEVVDLFEIGNFCGHSEGDLSILGHPGHWIATGSLHVFYGLQTGLNGIANVVPDATRGHSCVTGARTFFFTYAFVLA